MSMYCVAKKYTTVLKILLFIIYKCLNTRILCVAGPRGVSLVTRSVQVVNILFVNSKILVNLFESSRSSLVQTKKVLTDFFRYSRVHEDSKLTVSVHLLAILLQVFAKLLARSCESLPGFLTPETTTCDDSFFGHVGKYK